MKKKCGSRNRFSLNLYYLKSEGGEGWGGGLSESVSIFEKNIPGNSEMMNPLSMFYNIIGEEILFTALIYLRSSWAGKNTRQLVKYSSVLYFKPTKNVYVYI